MSLITILEQIAKNAHHQISVKDLICMQPNEIQEAFLNNDAMELKKQLCDVNNLADRCTVFQE